jgi:hypothetical protein
VTAPDQVLRHTQEWLDKVVIGLNLCPFAGAAQANNSIRFAVSSAQTEEQLVTDLSREMLALAEQSPRETETTLLIHPAVLTEFSQYNDFLDLADAMLDQLYLTGVLQVASFHPDYQFADSAPDAIENYSNRSPYPMLHLLREESVSQAVDSHPDIASIPETNIATLRKLGRKGWQQLALSYLASGSGLPSSGSGLP